MKGAAVKRLSILVVLALLTLAVPVEAAPKIDCNERPRHPWCLAPGTPSPSPTAAPTPTVAPTPTIAPTPTPTPVITPSPDPTATPAPTATPTVAPSPSASIPVIGWALVFEDQFDTLDKSRYSAYPCCWGDTRYKQGDTVNGGLYTGTDRMFGVNGMLELRLYRDANNQPRSINPAPRLPSGNNHQLYGRYEIRMRASSSEGWKVAYLLWPESETWPRDGEIDFPEVDPLYGTVSAFMHRQGAISGGDQDAYSTSYRLTDWHTYVIEWRPDDLRFYVDGDLIGHSTSRVPNTPMRWQLQTETSLDWSRIPSAEATVFIDYVKVWEYQP